MSFTKIDDGDSFAAATVDANFDTLRAHLNALPTSALDERALSSAHFTDGIIPGDITKVVTVETGAATLTKIETIYPGTNTSTFVDPPGTGAGTTEWNLIKPGAVVLRHVASPLSTGVALGMGGGKDGIAAYLVLANIEVRQVDDVGQTPVEDSMAAVFAVMYKDSTDAWNVIKRTERHFMQPVATAGVKLNLVSYRDQAIRTLIMASDITAGDTKIYGIQVVGAINLEPSAGVYNAHDLEYYQANLTVIPLHAADPV